MEVALRSILISDADILRMVGERIYPLTRPQGSGLPAIVYQRVSGDHDSDMEGFTGLVDSRFLIFFYADGGREMSAYMQARQLRTYCVNKFNGFHERVGDVDVQGVFIVSEDDNRIDDGIESVVRIKLDCRFWYNKQ